MRSPSIIHQPFPISQITPSTIVLGSSFYSAENDDGSDSEHKIKVDTTAATAAPPDSSQTLAPSASNSPPMTSPQETSASPTTTQIFGQSSIVASLEQSVEGSTTLSSSSSSSSSSTAAAVATASTKDGGATTEATQQTSGQASPTTSNSPQNIAYDESEGAGSSSNSTIAIPFSNRQIEASSVLVTSNEPPERCTSPRRDNTAIERIGREKVHVLRKEAQLMQDSLTDILDRIVRVRDEYDRLSGENRFLQDYIGNLMATSNILNKA